MEGPLYYEIQKPPGRVHVTYCTQPTFDQWAATMRSILREPHYEPGFGMLLDRSRVPHPAATAYIHQMVDFIERHAAQSGDARWAVLVADIGSYGMARMAEILGPTGKIRGFMVSEEAKAWL